VFDAISSLGYRRDAIARSLRRSKTGTIGLMISDITNPFFPDVVRGVEDVVYANGQDYNLILCNTEENGEKERLYLNVLLEKRVDGIVMAPAGGNQNYLRELLADGFPVVFVDRWIPGIDADAVVVDNVDASYQIVNHLIRLGHRRIAIMKARLDSSAIDERLEGYQAALASAGIPFDPAYVFESNSSIDDGRAAGMRLLGSSPPPTAVFGTNNFVTIGMMNALAQCGLRCPEDLAVVGFDDFPWASAFHPGLTTVAQPGYALGQTAANLLFQRMNNKEAGPAVKKVLTTTLMIRESCGSATGKTSPTALPNAGGYYESLLP
jgi:LacI family transcriptional regulator